MGLRSSSAISPSMVLDLRPSYEVNIQRNGLEAVCKCSHSNGTSGVQESAQMSYNFLGLIKIVIRRDSSCCYTQTLPREGLFLLL